MQNVGAGMDCDETVRGWLKGGIADVHMMSPGCSGRERKWYSKWDN